MQNYLNLLKNTKKTRNTVTVTARETTFDTPEEEDHDNMDDSESEEDDDPASPSVGISGAPSDPDIFDVRL